MRVGLKGVLAVAIATAVLTAGTADADPIKCRRAIVKEYGKYIAAASKIIDKCKNSAITKGDPANIGLCPRTAVGSDKDKIASAAAKMKQGIANQCGGKNKICNAADTGDNADDSLASIAWNIGNCMNFENSADPQCSQAITDCGDIGDCLECIAYKTTTDAGAIEQAVDNLLYDNFENANFFPNGATTPTKERRACQVEIAKVSVKFLQAKTKILNKCIDAKFNNKAGFNDNVKCPDTDPGVGSGNPPGLPGDTKATEAIRKAEQKKIAAICKKCGAGGDSNKDGVCDLPVSGPTANIDDILENVPYPCNDVTAPPNQVNGPLGRDCGAITVTDLASYIDCIDCVLEFKVDCMTDAGSGDGNGIPGDGNGGALGIDYAAECDVTPCGNGMIDPGEDCDPPGGNVCPNAGNGLELCSANCTCDCPGTVTFQGDVSDPDTDLDTGWTGFAHNAGIVSDGLVTVDVSGCDDGVGIPTADNRRDPACGVCDITGPLPNANAGAGELDSQRCQCNHSVTCNAPSDCPGSCPCVTFFGSLLPLSAGGVSSCVANEFSGGIVGTANIETGESANTVNLISHVWLGNGVDDPCPQCVGDGVNNDGVAGGTCSRGSRSGLACDGNGTSAVPTFGTTSLDCPVGVGTVGDLPIDLSNSTGTESRVITAGSPTCTAPGFSTFKCVCDTCTGGGAEPVRRRRIVRRPRCAAGAGVCRRRRTPGMRARRRASARAGRAGRSGSRRRPTGVSISCAPTTGRARIRARAARAGRSRGTARRRRRSAAATPPRSVRSGATPARSCRGSASSTTGW
jgi:hypothetical protein